ncbi:MAG: alpha-E domain-containing protein [Phenylobacterium sp.]
MMLARVADSLYWIGRYVERAEHMCRLADVLLNSTLDRTESSGQVARMVVSAISDGDPRFEVSPWDAAVAITMDNEEGDSVTAALARARENARQVRDQLTTETWERLNLIYLRVTGSAAPREFSDAPSQFLHDIIADLHLFKGAADATMSHGEGWGFLQLGVFIERAQLTGRLLQAGFGQSLGRPVTEHAAMTALLRMSCALEPYLRKHTADIQPRLIRQFLMFDEDFPRSLRFTTARIEEHLSGVGRNVDLGGAAGPERLAGRLRARFQYAEAETLTAEDSDLLVATVLEECARLHAGIYDNFVAYSLEMRLPA